MFDSAQRNIHYLRLSVTDLCNLRCRYCMPDGVEKLEREAVLTYEEFLRLAALFARCGIDTVRVTGGEPLADLNALQQMLDAIPTTHKVYINTTFPAQETTTFDEMLAFTERNKHKITCMNISRHLVHYVEESPDEILGKIACPTRINCVLYKDYPKENLIPFIERFRKIPGASIQFRFDYTATTPENLYEPDKILHDLKEIADYTGLDGCRMRCGFHFDYKGMELTYHKTLPYSTIVETGEDGVTYDILYDILIKQNGDIHSDWTGVKLDVEKYRHVTYEPYDLRVLNGTIDF